MVFEKVWRKTSIRVSNTSRSMENMALSFQLRNRSSVIVVPIGKKGKRGLFSPLLSTVERTSGKCHFRCNKFNIHLTRCLWLKKAMIVPKGRNFNIMTITTKYRIKGISVFESAHKVTNFYG